MDSLNVEEGGGGRRANLAKNRPAAGAGLGGQRRWEAAGSGAAADRAEKCKEKVTSPPSEEAAAAFVSPSFLPTSNFL